MTKSSKTELIARCFGHLDFEFVSSFGFRASDLSTAKEVGA
jgi:hypothetical protein